MESFYQIPSRTDEYSTPFITDNLYSINAPQIFAEITKTAPLEFVVFGSVALIFSTTAIHKKCFLRNSSRNSIWGFIQEILHEFPHPGNPSGDSSRNFFGKCLPLRDPSLNNSSTISFEDSSMIFFSRNSICGFPEEYHLLGNFLR